MLTPTISGISSAITPSYQYFWTPTSLCPANDCQSLNNLNAGVYSVTVIATFGTKSDTVEVNNITINDSTKLRIARLSDELSIAEYEELLGWLHSSIRPTADVKAGLKKYVPEYVAIWVAEESTGF